VVPQIETEWVTEIPKATMGIDIEEFRKQLKEYAGPIK